MGIAHEYQILISKEILSEIRGVLRVKFKYDLSTLELWEELFLASFELVDPKERIHFVKKDPDDDKILECAVEGSADFIVSGDKHLLTIKAYRGIKILTAREFLGKKTTPI